MKTVYDYVGQKLLVDEEIFILVGSKEEQSIFFDGSTNSKFSVGLASFSTGKIRCLSNYIFEAETHLDLESGLKTYGLVPRDSHIVFI